MTYLLAFMNPFFISLRKLALGLHSARIGSFNASYKETLNWLWVSHLMFLYKLCRYANHTEGLLLTIFVETKKQGQDIKIRTWRAIIPAESWDMGCAVVGNLFKTSNTNPVKKNTKIKNHVLSIRQVMVDKQNCGENQKYLMICSDSIKKGLRLLSNESQTL